MKALNIWLGLINLVCLYLQLGVHNYKAAVLSAFAVVVCFGCAYFIWAGERSRLKEQAQLRAMVTDYQAGVVEF